MKNWRKFLSNKLTFFMKIMRLFTGINKVHESGPQRGRGLWGNAPQSKVVGPPRKICPRNNVGEMVYFAPFFPSGIIIFPPPTIFFTLRPWHEFELDFETCSLFTYPSLYSSYYYFLKKLQYYPCRYLVCFLLYCRNNSQLCETCI